MIDSNMEVFLRITLICCVISNVTNECCVPTLIRYMSTNYDERTCGEIVPGGRQDHRSPNACEVYVCQNGLVPVGVYCGRGPCNVFGCACDGGCVTGDEAYPSDTFRNFFERHNERRANVHL